MLHAKKKIKKKIAFIAISGICCNLVPRALVSHCAVMESGTPGRDSRRMGNIAGLIREWAENEAQGSGCEGVRVAPGPHCRARGRGAHPFILKKKVVKKI